ncbi:MAG: hypothetical protein JWN63_97 [Candidatus Acidoferrum typicum]|nr:hypothetical protein [Candidatus Acidoferrum typicum]
MILLALHGKNPLVTAAIIPPPAFLPHSPGPSFSLRNTTSIVIEIRNQLLVNLELSDRIGQVIRLTLQR